MESSPAVPVPTVECGFCDSIFINELLRIQHIRQLHSEHLKYSCELCGVKCETQAKVNSHIIGKHIRAKNRKNNNDGADVASIREKFKIKKPVVSKKRIELACIRYASIHGQHKAQLKYAKLHPDLKLGWQKITELMNRYKLDGRLEKQSNSAHQSKVRARNKRNVSKAVRSIPESIRNQCAQYGIAHGPDEAQWEFTIRYPNHVFPYASVKKWTDEMKFKQTTKNFPGDFVAALNEVLQDSEKLTIGDIEDKVKHQVQFYNLSKTEKNAIDETNAVSEWLHILNYQVTETEKAKKPNHCTCGNVYKTEEELLKHKPKCWVPETQVRSQRSCRINKSVASECENISDSDSDSSLPLTEEVKTFKCSDCGYQSIQCSSYKKHIKMCGKKKGAGEKNKIKREILDSEFAHLRNCKRCSFKHITIEGLREHYRVSHNTHYTDEGEEMSLHCADCNDTFITYPGFREHVCGERQVKVTYERIKPRVSSAISLGTSSVVVFICPRCVVKFDTMQQLKDHYSGKFCTIAELYAGK